MSDPIRKFKNILLEAHLQGGGTVSKLEANYTNHALGQDQCRFCKNFLAPDQCRIVEGSISPNGWCKFFTQETLVEKWGVTTSTTAGEKGKYKNKTKAELLRDYNALKKSGPHKKGSPEYSRMRELAFAIRAKSGWGKVKEE